MPDSSRPQGINKDPGNRTSQLNSIRGSARGDQDHQDKVATLGDALEYAESIVDTVREPLLVLDGDLRIKTASRSFYRTFGVSREETDERLVYEIGNGQWNIPALKKLLEEILPQKNAFENFEVSHNFPGLGARTILLNARMMWRGETSTTRILLAFEDITERRRAENELLRSNEDLQSFAYVAAHDLRTPLGAALNLSIILERRLQGRLDEKEAEMFKYVIQSMDRLGQLMNDILAYSELGHSQKQQTFVTFEEALHIARENLKNQIEKSDAKIEIKTLPGISCDRTLVALVLQNLIGNALKYRRETAPQICIEGLQEDGFWRISVSDNGEGFAQELAEKIFEPFKRVSASDAPGSGIGLATCKRIIERLGGKIWAEGRPGEGSTFFFTLPVIASAPL
jgi:PAS domain S-box-containing protein